MWYAFCRSTKAELDFVSSVGELLQSTSRNLIFVTGGAYLAWYFLATSGLPSRIVVGFLLITVVVALICVLSLWLLPRWFLAAQVVWQVGLAVATTLAVYVSQQPEVAFSYALLPLVAVVTVGWSAGLVAEGAVIALVWWLSHKSTVVSIPPDYGLAVVVCGIFTGMIGWSVTHSLLTVTQWSLFSFEQAREKMEEARDRQLELKQVQEDLIHANRELARLSDRFKVMYQVAEEARQAKAEFVANVSHELRTPLNMIIGFSEMITQSPEVYGDSLPPALLADISAIQRSSQHLARLVDDVLDLSQVEAGRMALSKDWVSLETIVSEAIESVRSLFESKGLYLEDEITGDLPAVFCDGTRVRQVVINLLSNAGRFTGRGGALVKVWREGGGVSISVTDTGPGIAPEDQTRVFEPFQQLDGSTRRRYGGSGLGLSISKRFVEMHGGRMWLESTVDAGTTITFSLPLETPRSHGQAGGDAMRWFSPYSEYEYRARIRQSKTPIPLVVPRYVLLEEGESLQRLFARYLDSVETTSVHTAGEAMAELSQSPAQALIVNAPAFGEAPFASEELRNLPYGIPMVTCWVPGDDEAAAKLGVVSYLTKPVTRDTLLATLASLGEDVKQVLLVDDEREMLRLFSRMLSSAEQRYHVLWATNGQRTLNLLRERHPDVMLLDLIMPDMDGFQVLQEKSQDPSIRDIPVIVVSSMDLASELIMSDTLTVTRGRGLSARELLACVQAISEILSPTAQSDDPGRLEKPAV